ncbi:hypothetical protein BpHYR1_001394 [Brachionus plicatilis]|uniref:Uncharacterized protein n=1 Tax=Brachionus plicatilis TaxID=10195 RepID=A0A3M7QG71_BRAPC|nr:hypothetical protein BpHYR1_001394 [Brachionus plicatilis]
MSMFGQTIKSYSTLQSSCLTLVGIVFGELNFKNYYNHNSSVGTILITREVKSELTQLSEFSDMSLNEIMIYH